ncbi:pectate lyase family protein [Geofilum sp. OHC36d9]|uniref:pectate lyase family protein n=1 Tax=Geofilum sp. OHC36d9 TaxID=3458413 RepID=UPI0040348DE7
MDLRFFIALYLLLGGSLVVTAQYPTISEKDQKASAELMQHVYQHSDSAWQVAWPIVEQQAKEGKPYIPWAARPTDLPQANIPAFPGAEGGGMFSFGGRGGKVIVVNTLADSGPGSFRWACEQGGARIIVFNVSGIIRIKSPVVIRAPYVTIAGQTAPGDGVCIAGESVWINTHDVVIRHMRFRRGETWVGRRDDSLGGNPVGNIMLDHISATWGLDENMSIYRHMWNDSTGKKDVKLGTVNITIQNSIFAEALDTWNHAFGATLGGENCSFMRNLYANNTGRNPSIGWNGIFNFVNNVVFNWRHRSVDGGDYTAKYNIINNYFKPGPITQLDEAISHRILKPESGRSQLDKKVYGMAYVHGNVVEGNERVTKDNWDGGVQIESMPDAGSYTDEIRWHEPWAMPYLTIMSADEAFNYVIENVGATWPVRDAVDQRITREVKTGVIEYAENVNLDKIPKFKYRRLPDDSYKMGIITHPDQVGGYPDYVGKAYKDTDRDGMPDTWEKKYGLDPKNSSDANGDINGDGYTNIEKYINGIDPTQNIDWSDLSNNHDTLKDKTSMM